MTYKKIKDTLDNIHLEIIKNDDLRDIKNTLDDIKTEIILKD